MIDKSFIGYVFSPIAIEVEKGRLRFFSKAIGNDDPIYTDEEAAKLAGHPSLPVPLTFLFCLEMDRENPLDFLDLLNIDISRILHGEQEFICHAMAYAGDQITFSNRISDIYERKGGALEFIVIDTDAVNQRGVRVGQMRRVIAVKNS